MKTTDRYKAFSITIPSPLHRELDRLCQRETRSRSEVVRDALRIYLSAQRGTRAFPLTLPSDAEERSHAQFGAFAEWMSELDRAYDVLAEK